jgi:hypothetical protein
MIMKKEECDVQTAFPYNYVSISNYLNSISFRLSESILYDYLWKAVKRNASKNVKGLNFKICENYGVNHLILRCHNHMLKNNPIINIHKYFVNCVAGLLHCHNGRNDNGKRIYSIYLAGKSEAPSPFSSKRDNTLTENE